MTVNKPKIDIDKCLFKKKHCSHAVNCISKHKKKVSSLMDISAEFDNLLPWQIVMKMVNNLTKFVEETIVWIPSKDKTAFDHYIRNSMHIAQHCYNTNHVEKKLMTSIVNDFHPKFVRFFHVYNCIMSFNAEQLKELIQIFTDRLHVKKMLIYSWNDLILQLHAISKRKK